MACVQQTRASCESDYYEKEKTVSNKSQSCYSSEHAKHDHKTAAYSSQSGYQAVAANGHQTCNSASPNKHPTHIGHTSGHLSLTEKVTGLFGKSHQSSGCNTHGHQASAHGSHGHIMAGHGSHGHNSSGCNGSSHSHHKVSHQESYEFEEKKKEYRSCKTGGQKKVEKKVKKSSYKCSSSSDSESDKEH